MANGEQKTHSPQDVTTAIEVAERIRWFRDRGYGLFVHWQTDTAAAGGPTLPFREAVDRFPVTAFADQAAETGAGYVIFTITHVLTHRASNPRGAACRWRCMFNIPRDKSDWS